MTNVIELAKQAECPEGFIGSMILEQGHVAWIERFAKLVRNAALDEVAHKLPHIISTWRITGGPPTVSGERHVIEAIRNLKEQTP